MQSPFVVIFMAATVLAATVASAAQSLAVGEYFRPRGADVSGHVNASTAYVRSPCPALNTLANHGFLPRDGKNITHVMLSTALRDVYNIGQDVVDELVDRLPKVISLSDLSKHNFIEHDASLVHADASFTFDPSAVSEELWTELLSHATDGTLGASELATVRRERVTRCQAKTQPCEYGAKQRFLALGESALLLRGLGGSNTESISVEFAKSFLVHEQIPPEYKKPTSPVGLAGVLVTAGNIQLLALFQDFVALFWSE